MDWRPDAGERHGAEVWQRIRRLPETCGIHDSFPQNLIGVEPHKVLGFGPHPFSLFCIKSRPPFFGSVCA